MTATCAILSKKAITLSCDSFLTAFPNGRRRVLEAQRSKIIKFERLQGAVAYWGLATFTGWDTYEWLQNEIRNVDNGDDLNSWGQAIATKLNEKYSLWPLYAKQFGLGIHLVGYELVEGVKVPEMWLITNYNGLSPEGIYQVGNTFSCSRRTYFDLKRENVPPTAHGEMGYRRIMKEYFQGGDWMLFNNGDVPLFMSLANGLGSALNLALKRHSLNRTNAAETQRNLAKMIIKIMCDFQKVFFQENRRVVGGRVHRLTILPSGIYQNN